MSDQPAVIEAIHEGVAMLTLNRPEVKNAMNGEMIEYLVEAFKRLGTDNGVRAIVLAANGDAFCSGADLGYMAKVAQQQATNQAGGKTLTSLFRGIAECPKPVIAKVHGLCFAGAMGLVCAADILVASENVTFSLPEVKVGLIAATISPFVVQAMGVRASRRYFLTAETFTAQQGRDMGMVHEVVKAENLNDSVGAIIKALSKCAPGAVAESKVLVRDVAGADITSDDTHADVASRLARVRGGTEAAEGMMAFLQKRKPAWVQG